MADGMADAGIEVTTGVTAPSVAVLHETVPVVRTSIVAGTVFVMVLLTFGPTVSVMVVAETCTTTSVCVATKVVVALEESVLLLLLPWEDEEVPMIPEVTVAGKTEVIVRVAVPCTTTYTVLVSVVRTNGHSVAVHPAFGVAEAGSKVTTCP